MALVILFNGLFCTCRLCDVGVMWDSFCVAISVLVMVLVDTGGNRSGRPTGIYDLAYLKFSLT